MRTLDKYLNLKPYVNTFYHTFSIPKLIPLLPYYVNTSYFNLMDKNLMIHIIDYFDTAINWDNEMDIITREQFYKNIVKFNSAEALQNFELLIDYHFDDKNFYNPLFVRKTL